ncbi:MAG: hypothetical protein HY049_05920 [Acidobacteria bacterium]|nr:hypothetical protein [Acidobacteriota bacterium]
MGRVRASGPLLAACAVCAALTLAGCEKPPTPELEATRDAVDGAVRASAGKWAVAETESAKEIFAGAGREIERQDARFGPARDYSRARTLLAAARDDGEAAHASADREREAAEAEAKDAVRRARTLLDGARAAIRIAPSPRDGRAELERLKDELHDVDLALPDVDRMIAVGDFLEAARKGHELGSRVEAAVSRFFGKIDRGAARAPCSGAPEGVSCEREVVT